MSNKSCLILICLFGIAASLPLEEGTKSRRQDDDPNKLQLNKKEIVGTLENLVKGILQKPETNQILNMFKGFNGEYNFDLNMLLDNGLFKDSTEANKGNNVEGIDSPEIVKRSADSNSKESNSTASGMDFKQFIPGGMGGSGSDSKGGFGSFMSFIPGGMGSSGSDSKASGGMGSFMSLIPGGFGRKKREESSNSTTSQMLPEMPAQKLPEMPAQKLPEMPAQKLPEMPAQKLPEMPAQLPQGIPQMISQYAGKIPLSGMANPMTTVQNMVNPLGMFPNAINVFSNNIPGVAQLTSMIPGVVTQASFIKTFIPGFGGEKRISEENTAEEV